MKRGRRNHAVEEAADAAGSVAVEAEVVGRAVNATAGNAVALE